MRRNFNDGQEITFEDLSRIAIASERGIFDRIVYQLMQRKEDAFFGDSFFVSYATSTSVSVRAGVGFQTDGTQVSPEPQKRMLYLASNTTVSLDAPDGANDRIDIICVKHRVSDELTESRKFKNASTSVVTTESLVTQKDWNAEVIAVSGTPAGSPSAPSVPSGYLKIAECLVPAAAGMADQDDITDSRTLMPVGGEMLINTTGFARLTAGSATKVDTLIAEIDALLTAGLQSYTTYIDQGSDPSNPASGRHVIWRDNAGNWWTKNSSGTKSLFGSGGGGGGGAAEEWTPADGLAPLAAVENNQQVWKFADGGSAKLVMFLRVPSSFVTGRPIAMNIGLYSPSSANTIKLQAVATLIRANTDAVDSTTNQRTTTNTALTNTVANQLRSTSLDLTSAAGQINSVNVSAGDMIKIELTRDSGTDTDTADIRFIPTMTEVTFS